MLALIRDFPRLLRNRDEGKWERWPAGLLYGKKAVILGIGVIGREIAKKCKAFGMTVYGISRVRRVVPQPTDGVDSYLGPEDLEEAASVADFLVIVAPYTPETYRIVNREILIRMKPTAFLINIGRGELVDEEALIDALKTGRIAGAALDTFVQEPLPSNHPFWSMENVIITPHVGGMSDIYVEQALSVFEENLRRFLAGERKNLINLFAE
jgi:D-2-hydroxyacid dehydrogenase (NADP+)